MGWKRNRDYWSIRSNPKRINEHRKGSGKDSLAKGEYEKLEEKNKINTDKFEYANLKCSFGSMNVYFDNAIMEKENAVVKIDVSFAGMQLYIPRGWNVINNTSASFGAVEEKNRIDAVKTNTLTLIGGISFAGVEIFYI